MQNAAMRLQKLILPCALMSIPLFTSCHKTHEAHHEQSKFIATYPIQKDTSVVKDYVCQIHSIQHIELRALEKGYLQTIHVDEGQFIPKGQLMFEVMPMLYEAELQKARAEVNFVEIEYLNTKSLADSDIVSPNELALAKAKLDKAKAEMALAQVHLDFTKVSAPFDGIMDRFHVRLGSLVEEGELLTTLSDNSKMWVYFNVPEAEYLDYKQNHSKDAPLRVHLIMANGQEFSEVGIVDAIEADFNNQTGNIAFRATFNNPNRLLRHGETGNVHIHSKLKNALLIPQKATFEILDKKYVFIVQEGGEVSARKIQVSHEINHLYVVENGLDTSDVILIEGLRKVRNGDQVAIDLLSPKEVLSSLELYAE